MFIVIDGNICLIGKDLAAIAQLVVAPVGGVPLEGTDFLLDAVDFQNPVDTFASH